MSHIISTSSPAAISINETNTIDAVLQNIRMILSTIKGTVPLYREFGIDGRSIDKPFDIAKTMLVIDIEEAVREFEPRAEIKGITFSADKDNPGRIIPAVEVTIHD